MISQCGYEYMINKAVTAAAFVVPTAAFILRSSWERKQLVTEHYRIESPKVREDVRIAFLTDVHDRLSNEGIKAITKAVKAAEPDCVLFGGDIITARNIDRLLPDIDMLGKLLASLTERYPVFYAEGNHETSFRERYLRVFGIFNDVLRETGATYLCNDSIVFNGIRIFGISMDRSFYAKPWSGIGSHYYKKSCERDYFLKLVGRSDAERFNLALIHSPLYLKEAAEWGADLVLSGHFHGGTIRLPKLGGVMTPQYQFFLKECAGKLGYGKTAMIVSRGVGTHSINIRINDLPEITVVDILRSSADGGRADIQA